MTENSAVGLESEGMPNKHTVRAATAIVALALVAAACSSDADLVA